MKVLKVTLFIFVLFACGCSCVYSQDIEKLFDDANMFYNKEEVDNAIQAYETILSDGVKSANIYYNLGNSYLKKGNIGRAILNFERAKMVIPRDSELVFNLDYARGKIKQQDMAYYTNPLNSFLIRAARNISLNENIISTFALFCIFLIFVLLGLYLKTVRYLILILSLLVFNVSILSAIPLYFKYINYVNSAIIVDELVDARYEPEKDSDAHFPLYEGNKIFVLRETGDWYKVKRPDGKIGWVSKKSAVRLSQ